MAGKTNIEQKVAALGDLPREQLTAMWQKNFGTHPPRGVHRDLLVRAAAFHLQQKHCGNLSGEAKRLLTAAIRQARATTTANAAKTEVAAAPPLLLRERQTVRAGARLIREWNGINHIVDAVDGAFIYAGSRYRSLSKIAREITGTNWSGPRFFGL